jgi:hypothetical protein
MRLSLPRVRASELGILMTILDPLEASVVDVDLQPVPELENRTSLRPIPRDY